MCFLPHADRVGDPLLCHQDLPPEGIIPSAEWGHHSSSDEALSPSHMELLGRVYVRLIEGGALGEETASIASSGLSLIEQASRCGMRSSDVGQASCISFQASDCAAACSKGL